MSNKELVKFIKEARKRGFDDYQIREPLLKKGWPFELVEESFASLRTPIKFKNKVCVYLDSDLLRIMERRAKKNMLNVHEQIEDILRRSCINQKKSTAEEKLDDKFIALFSRKKRC